MRKSRRRKSSATRAKLKRRPTKRLSPKQRRRRAKLWRLGLFGLAGAVILALFFVIVPFWRLSSQFADAPVRQPSRLYESPPLIEVGSSWTAGSLSRALADRGYREQADGELAMGRYRQSEGRLAAHLRSFATEAGWSRPARLEVQFGRRTVNRIEIEGQAAASTWIDPLPLASYYGSALADRWPERVDRVPRFALLAVLAAEDAAFFNHPGLSPSGILRALWVNLRGGEVIQGGSTLTQQLVKNLYLTQERTLERKAREAVLALFLELRYEKRQILEAYLNEIYFGRIDSVDVVGVGAAARAFFGVPPAELTLSEAALVAGVIRSPSRLSPVFHPEAALERRNEVLTRMLELGWIDETAHDAGVEEKLRFEEPDRDLYRARYAADAAASEARRRFGIEELAEKGYALISTLSAADQWAAEDTMRDELAKIEAKRNPPDGPAVQGVLISADPGNGRILAYVGGRDYAGSQYDRLRFAKRQPGSAFKPLVLAAAFSERVAVPSTRLVDEPITVRQGGRSWAPKNDDRQFHGEVSVRETIERSLNVPTVRLALSVGLDHVIDWSRRLGVESSLAKVPSLALGAFEMTPLELLGAYATVAAAGRTVDLHLVQSVLSAEGAPLPGDEIDPAAQVLEPAVAYMITSVLEGVTDKGTARRLRALGLGDRLAAKTGTSSGGRDGWLIGYAPERATLVWVGFDDGQTGGLSGSRSALPLFATFMKARRPRSGYGVAQLPLDATTVTIDPETGGIAVGGCPSAVAEVFFADRPPRELCPQHARRGFWPSKWRRRTRSE